MVPVLEFLRPTVLTMLRKATLAEAAGLRLICTGPSSRPENSQEASRVIHRPRNGGASPDIIRQPSTMNLDTIHQRHAANLAVHIQDRDRATAVVAHTPAAAVADTHRTATADIRPTLAEDRHPTMEAVHRRMVAEAAIATHTPQAPTPTTAKRRASLVDENRKSDGQPTVALFCI